jgi:nitrate/TMAO reductase-like tetraheme cytochrome c subunit
MTPVDDPRSAHPVSAVGIALTTVSAVLFLSLWALDAAGWIRNPYIGLFAFLALPVLFVAGLLLIPWGAWLARRRAQRGLDALPRWPRFDLNETRTRRLALFVLLASVVNVLLVMAAGGQAVHYMDSPAFCGSVCHPPMQPQFVQWQRTQHAQIACVDCHVGGERGSFLKAKIAGTRRLAHVITGTYPRPIAADQGTIPAAAFTCEQCHSKAAFASDKDKLVVIRSYADDETNSESTTTLRVHVGMGPSPSPDEGRVHWHAAPGRVIEYAVTDVSESTIPWVRVTEPDGRTRIFAANGVNPNTPPAPTRRLDCLGCHSRPAHRFAPSAERAVDRAIAEGQFDRSLPYVRRETVRALTASHAEDDVAKSLRAFYATAANNRARSTDGTDSVERTIRAAQALYRQHVFPSMHVTWGTYVNQLGHTDAPGCFRCHDDAHKAADGRVIRQDCTLCHAMEQ